MIGDEPIDLGPCCGCRTTENVRNVIILDRSCAVPGHGWGCFTCNLPADGASMVLCDPCFEGWRNDGLAVREVCRGYPSEDGREPIETARARRPFDHDEALHHLADAGESALLN